MGFAVDPRSLEKIREELEIREKQETLRKLEILISKYDGDLVPIVNWFYNAKLVCIQICINNGNSREILFLSL